MNLGFQNMSNQPNRLINVKIIQCLHTEIKDGAQCIYVYMYICVYIYIIYEDLKALAKSINS